jgi:tetratricopeptide (TPR) repeat protein
MAERLSSRGFSSNLPGMSNTGRAARPRPSWKSRLILALPLFLLALPAAAQGREEKEREARTACLGGDYTKGVMILSELFVSTRDATYIYNQGRCFEQNGRFQEAITRFQEYLRVAKDAGPAERAEAERHVSDCRLQLGEQSPRSVAPPQPPPAVAPVPPTLRQPVAAEPSAPAPGSGLRTAGLVVAAVGVAGVAAGIALNLKVNALASDYETYNGYTEKKESDRRSYESWGWVGYGAGAACIGTGAVLYYLGVRAGKSSSLSATILPAPRGGVLVVGGRL